jgi:hypothetical protein
MKLGAILNLPRPPTLLIGNGINRHGRLSTRDANSWEGLLQEVARRYGITLSDEQLSQMSNTERYDILDLARPLDDRESLQKCFCDLMASWTPGAHHTRIISWAKRHDAPVITVNFDELLSQSVGAQLFGKTEGFTDYYPWSRHFSDREVTNADSEFAIWHAHGMKRYSRSVRLGLTHYMGSVQRARGMIYGKSGLRNKSLSSLREWGGYGTWLEPFFHSPLLILGFGFGKDETFLRWLFLERARYHRIRPDRKTDAWFLQKSDGSTDHRRRFLDELGIRTIYVREFEEMYEVDDWLK